MRAAQMRGRGAPPGLIETLFNHSRTSSDRKCLYIRRNTSLSAPQVGIKSCCQPNVTNSVTTIFSPSSSMLAGGISLRNSEFCPQV